MREYQVDIDKSIETCEMVIKEFLIGKSTEIRFTQVRWGLIFKKGGPHDRKFRKVLDKLSPSFIKDEIEETHEGELENWLENKSHYYYYQLTPEMKSILLEDNLLLGINFSELSKNFYGFEDPTFLQDSYIIGKIISHECNIFLFLEPEERDFLKGKGIEFLE